MEKRIFESTSCKNNNKTKNEVEHFERYLDTHFHRRPAMFQATTKVIQHEELSERKHYQIIDEQKDSISM